MIVAVCTICSKGEVISVPKPPPPMPSSETNQTVGVNGEWSAKANSTAAADPGDGKIVWSTANQYDASHLYISNRTSSNIDFANVWSKAAPGNVILVQRKNDASRKCSYTVTSVTNHTTWCDFGVTPGSNCTGLPFSNNDALVIGIEL